MSTDHAPSEGYEATSPLRAWLVDSLGRVYVPKSPDATASESFTKPQSARHSKDPFVRPPAIAQVSFLLLAIIFAVPIASCGGRIALLDYLCLVGACLIAGCQWWGLRPVLPACIAVGVGLLPQTLFLLTFNSGFEGSIEPSKLARPVELYEDSVVSIHEYVESHLVVSPWILFGSSLAIVFLVPLSRGVWLASWIVRFGAGLSRLALVGLSATTFTLLGPISSGGWSPDLPLRFDAMVRAKVEADAKAEIARELIVKAPQAPFIRSWIQLIQALAAPGTVGLPYSRGASVPDAWFAAAPSHFDSTTHAKTQTDAKEANAKAQAETGGELFPQPVHTPIIQSWIRLNQALAAQSSGGRPHLYMVSDERTKIAFETVTAEASILSLATLKSVLALEPSNPTQTQFRHATTLREIRKRAADARETERAADILMDGAVKAIVSSIPLTDYELINEFIRPFAERFVHQAAGTAQKWTARMDVDYLLSGEYRGRMLQFCAALVGRITSLSFKSQPSIENGIIRAFEERLHDEEVRRERNEDHPRFKVRVP